MICSKYSLIRSCASAVQLSVILEAHGRENAKTWFPYKAVFFVHLEKFFVENTTVTVSQVGFNRTVL